MITVYKHHQLHVQHNLYVFKLTGFGLEAGGSLDTKEIEKMEDKDYLTPLDFIACCDRDPEFVNRFCY